MMTGVKGEIDLASNARAKRAEELVKINKYDYGVELGLGFNFYFPSFKIFIQHRCKYDFVHFWLLIKAKNESHLYIFSFLIRPHPLLLLLKEKDGALNISKHCIFHINLNSFSTITQSSPQSSSSLSLRRGVGVRLSSKHLIILIDPALVFNRILFPHREIIHFIYIQDPYQVGMSYKIHTVKIVGLPFHMISRQV